MKKIIFVLLILFFLPMNVYAYERIEVKLKTCIDGDTARFIMNNKEIKLRFLAIDTPEVTPSKQEPYGKEAKNFTCDKLTNANKIEIEFDKNSSKKDKYNRYLAWVFYDNNLLQADLIKQGYAKVAYIYGDYKYTYILNDLEENAKKNKIGIYSSENYNEINENNNKKSLNNILKNLYANIYEFFSKILQEIY